MATSTFTANQISAVELEQQLAVATLEANASIAISHEIGKAPEADLTEDQVIEQILAAVHKHDFYPDNKDFVDSPYKANSYEVYAYFKNSVDVNDRESVAQFLEKYFDAPASELIAVVPQDWKPDPKPISSIKNEVYRSWAEKLNDVWLELCRQVKSSVKEHPDRYSLIYVPHTFVAPGGRFREFYYWDSYWVIKGLLACEMYETAKEVIRNFAYIVGLYGFIPNGQRKYYLNRSQPPFFIPMAYECYKATKDINFLKEVMPSLVAEFDWWIQNRRITVTSPSGQTQNMFRYFSSWKQPRHESYMADIHTASEAVVVKDRENMFQHIAAAAESGWDFSSRWFADGKTMSTIVTALIVPVDLNAFMCQNAKMLAELSEILGNKDEAANYAKQHKQMLSAFHDVFWNEDEGAWFDYYVDRQTHNKQFYGSVAAPIFAKCYKNAEQVHRTYSYLQKVGALSQHGGVPTSIAETGQQWDFPNAWSPLVHMLIVGLKETNDSSLENAAKDIAKTWLSSNYRQFARSGHMFEKYNVACKTDAAGCGGEYAVQTGFGWSNGTVLDLLSIYQNEDWAENE